MYKGFKLGIVIPAYDEEKLIAQTLKDMPPEADRIYVVDDGSKDATRQIAQNIPDLRICVLGDGDNHGPGAAVVTGYKKALADNMDIVVKMDGDNQMSVKYLPDLLGPIISGRADYAKGNRLTRLGHIKGMSKWRLFGNWLLTLLVKIASGYWKIGDPQNGYTAITREALKRIDLNKVYHYYGYTDDILIKLNVAGCRVADVPMPSIYGTEKSKIKYFLFISRVSPLLIRGFLFRLKMKYSKR